MICREVIWFAISFIIISYKLFKNLVGNPKHWCYSDYYQKISLIELIKKNFVSNQLTKREFLYPVFKCIRGCLGIKVKFFVNVIMKKTPKNQCWGSGFWPNSDRGLCTLNEGWHLKYQWLNILDNVETQQCCGSVSFWYRSGSSDPFRGNMNPAADPTY